MQLNGGYIHRLFYLYGVLKHKNPQLFFSIRLPTAKNQYFPVSTLVINGFLGETAALATKIYLDFTKLLLAYFIPGKWFLCYWELLQFILFEPMVPLRNTLKTLDSALRPSHHDIACDNLLRFAYDKYLFRNNLLDANHDRLQVLALNNQCIFNSSVFSMLICLST